jgi:hypothetical protein
MASLGTLELSRRRNSSVATLIIRSTEDSLVCYFGVNHRRGLGNDAEIVTHGVLEVLQRALRDDVGCASSEDCRNDNSQKRSKQEVLDPNCDHGRFETTVRNASVLCLVLWS